MIGTIISGISAFATLIGLIWAIYKFYFSEEAKKKVEREKRAAIQLEKEKKLLDTILKDQAKMSSSIKQSREALQKWNGSEDASKN